MKLQNNFHSEMRVKKHINKETQLKAKRLKKFWTILFLILITYPFSLNAQSWPPPGMEGSGTKEKPWQINTAEHLRTLSIYVNKRNGDSTIGQYYKLMNDIDLIIFSNWEPIGQGVYFSQDFQGHFNGNGKTIKNLTINRSEEGWIGLFGYIIDAEIENLCLEHCYVDGGYGVGGLVGCAEHSTITNCSVSGKIIGYAVGGLVGQMAGTTLTYCHSNGNVKGGANSGGLVGNNTQYTGSDLIDNKISNCYSTCVVNGGDGIGGLVGNNEKNSFISNSYATGKVIASEGSAGGLVGSNNGSISYCHAKGVVIGSDWVGGLVGYCSNYGWIVNCVAANDSVICTTNSESVNRITSFCNYFGCTDNYANIDMILLNSKGQITIIEHWSTIESGIGKSMATLKSRTFYATAENWCSEAWDIASATSVWDIDDGKSLPFLRKENNPLGITENVATASLAFYPNPANDKFVIEFEGIASLKLFDMLGREVLTQNIFGKTEINISNLPKGIYCVHVIFAGKTIVNSKIVKL